MDVDRIGNRPAPRSPRCRPTYEHRVQRRAEHGLEHRIGSLTPGKQADVILLDVARSPFGRLNNVPAAITFSDVRDVDTVLVAGEIRKRHGRLLGHDLSAERRRAEQSRDRLFAAAGVPVGATPVGVGH
ncbi:amidohydrolase family protein [Dactylosporangium siamense]|uniref:amidohydrolase family protein n=1 Tax=Dactylosporangium siamense TaxID=685454 RepID=UPI001943619B|nr:amidohydrolase family protein [Dactylosporangium siamense]